MLNNNLASKIVLGSASWGNAYGSFKKQKASKRSVNEILGTACRYGVMEVDTAPSYGDAELLIGNSGQTDFSVYSKISAEAWEAGIESSWKSVISTSEKVASNRLEGIMFHSFSSFMDAPNVAIGFMRELVDSGICKQWGVSVYTHEEAQEVLSFCTPDFIQAPASLADRRLDESGTLDKLAESGVAVHARSIFLQGLILEKASKIGQGLDSFLSWLARFENYSEIHGLSKLHMATLFILGDARYSKAVIGINSLENLLEILEVLDKELPVPDFREFPALEDVDSVDPRKWQL